MITSEEINKLNAGRTLRLATPILVQLYENKKQAAIARLIMSYKAGEVLEPIAAEISVYQTLLADIHRSNNTVEHLETKINK